MNMAKLNYSFKRGKKDNCFFIIPSVIVSKYKQNTWMSETKYITIGFLQYFFQINITKINKNIDPSVDQTLIDKMTFILNEYGYFISDVHLLTNFLKENKNIILLIKNCSTNHIYLQKTFINIIKYHEFIKQRG